MLVNISFSYVYNKENIRNYKKEKSFKDRKLEMDTVKWDHFMFLSNIHPVEKRKENELGRILNNSKFTGRDR